MYTQLVDHVRSYLCVDINCSVFVQKLEQIGIIAVNCILRHYLEFATYEHSNCHIEDYSTIESTLHSAICTTFPLAFMTEASNYRAQFLSLETTIVSAVLAFPSNIGCHFLVNIKFLTKKIEQVIEFAMIQMTELFLLAESISGFWKEIEKDSWLEEILWRLHVQELVSFKMIDRSFLVPFDLSRHAESLIDSYIVSLIRLSKTPGC